METEMKHTKTVETTPIDSDTSQIETKSYTDKLSFRKLEMEKKHPTSQDTLYRDVLTCLNILSDTEEVTIRIVKKHGEPFLITQTYTLERENHHGK